MQKIIVLLLTIAVIISLLSACGSHNVTQEFKGAMDSYEEFIIEYVDFMNSFDATDNSPSLLNEYNEYLSKYTETMQKLSEIEGDKLSAADYAYYIEVNGRITKKLLEIENIDIIPGDSSQADSTHPVDSKNEQARKAAEEIRDTYACVYPKMIENMLIEDYGFTYTQSHYGVTHASIDWNLYATSKLEEYVGMNCGEGAVVTQGDAEWYLSIELGFSDNAIEYAFENADIGWEN